LGLSNAANVQWSAHVSLHFIVIPRITFTSGACQVARDIPKILIDFSEVLRFALNEVTFSSPYSIITPAMECLSHIAAFMPVFALLQFALSPFCICIVFVNHYLFHRKELLLIPHYAVSQCSVLAVILRRFCIVQ